MRQEKPTYFSANGQEKNSTWLQVKTVLCHQWSWQCSYLTVRSYRTDIFFKENTLRKCWLFLQCKLMLACCAFAVGFTFHLDKVSHLFLGTFNFSFASQMFTESYQILSTWLKLSLKSIQTFYICRTLQICFGLHFWQNLMTTLLA